MTAYLKPGDKITLAAPDFYVLNSPADDKAYWQDVYEPHGVEVVHVSVHVNLTAPVVVAVFRNDEGHGGAQEAVG